MIILPRQLWLFVLTFLFCLRGYAQAPTEILFTGSYQQAPLTQVLQEIQAKTPVRFYFKPEWVTNLKVTKNFEREKVTTVVEALLENTELEAAWYHDYAVMLFPSAAHHPAIVYKDNEGKPLNRLLFGLPKNAQDDKKVALRGRVTSAKTGEPVVGATVSVPSLAIGDQTDANGEYRLLLPMGEHLVSYKSIELLPEERQVGLYAAGTLNLQLYQSVVALNEVEVRADGLNDRNVNTVQMGMNKLNIGVIRKMPTFMGEVDVVKSVMLLPGVSSVGEGSAGFNVRGGGSDQNLLLMGQIPIYNPSHLFGFFSVFNPDVVKDLNFYRGGIPPKYGGRLSSVLEVQQKEGQNTKLKGNGGVGPITSRLALEGPLFSPKTTFLVAGRASYPNWVLHSLKDKQLSQTHAAFYDGNANVTHTFSAKDKISFNSYVSHDAFGFTQDSIYSWQNIGASLKHTHSFSERLVGSLSGVFSKYRFGIEDQDSTNASKFSNGIWSASIKAEGNYDARQHQLAFGAEGIYHTFQPGKLEPASANSGVNPIALTQNQALEGGIFASDEYTITPQWTVMLGLRYSFYQNRGPGQVYVYAPGQPKQERTIIDTLSYGSGEGIAFYHGLEPRVSLKYSITEVNSIKAGYQRMRQYLHLISGAMAVAPIDFWQTSNTHLKPQVADQWSIGYFHNFSGNSIEFSVEPYYKRIQNQLDYKEGAELWLNPTIEADLLPGKGRTYGVEVQLAKKQGDLTGWASYTYSRSEIQVNGAFPEEQVNKGAFYPTNYDKPHTVSVVAAYQLTKRLAFTSNFIYSSGRPTTAPIGLYMVGGVEVPVYGDRNQARIPDYHRLDLSMTIEPNHRKDKKWEGRWSVSVYNVYGRQNAYSVFFRRDVGAPPQGYKLSVVGVPLPSITYDFKF
ncbi:TonB-dependent receptor [Rufibacter roseolus]|uniref:TonB-dependent receptor n=1 Tax=Rufibacter roseolus TaxID=2817375 RepID=UPI001B312639|nr:TonB-dependent receptor [Rufibacter roseolus]